MENELPAATRAWVEARLGGDRIVRVEALAGGWTSRMRRLSSAAGEVFVLRSFVDAFYRRHAPGLLAREAAILQLLAPTGVPAATLVAVDPDGTECADPSLLMTLLPGRIRLDTDGLAERICALARLLVQIHAIQPEERPRTYQAWTAPDRVRLPENASKTWHRAVDVIRADPPPYEGRFLHRDFHPGNVLFDGATVTGVVDWVETSWGPADLDVAHCATTLALLAGTEAADRFVAAYVEAGGTLDADEDAHRYWRVLDALGFAPDAEKVATPWRAVGRTDLTPPQITGRLVRYLERLL
ncbi:phosphotransferase family protein [Tenggerimyces flavus]|uniref:Phosphotransferase family protein n=1 Tax=Tenggerimyces flavus TaxID=1708749 RepID=A0ABV7Y5V9_9ACTN|nr:aminoglycoside phosphotransferase family protein [Tenggerimyces flavus]MBM7788457.1 aminoglycoside phosphotransferase (APT) family kinase protein [Tenggerimyces flavus]